MEQQHRFNLLDEPWSSSPFLIAGPCALETKTLTFEIAAELRALREELGLPVIFKGSYTKANRTREHSFHGVGLRQGLEWLQQVKEDFNLPVTSDVHEVAEVLPAAEVLDLIQIPALLCKNTNILHAVGATGKAVNVKKGHFVTAQDMLFTLEKLEARGNKNLLITERGTLFGYGEMIVDFRSIGILKSFGYPVVFDASHSVRKISERSEASNGGSPEAMDLLARCSAAAGADGLFVEVHPQPAQALCDGIVAYPLKSLSKLVKSFMAIRDSLTQVEQ